MIILTGSLGGIGSEILSDLAKLDEVIALYNSDNKYRRPIDNVTYLKIDLENEVSVNQLVDANIIDCDKLILIHCAVYNSNNLVLNYDLNSWDKTFNINVKGNFLLTKALLPRMLNARFGRIIHFSSVAASSGKIGTIAYSTTKSALHGMSKVISKEYGRFGITSNILELGYFNTGLINNLKSEEIKYILNQIPIGKLGSVDNIIHAIKFIIASDYLNGSTINLDGGIY